MIIINKGLFYQWYEIWITRMVSFAFIRRIAKIGFSVTISQSFREVAFAAAQLLKSPYI